MRTRGKQLPTAYERALSPTTRHVWRLAVHKRYVGHVYAAEYAKTYAWEAWAGNRVRSREPVLFMFRRTAAGRLRAVALFGLSALTVAGCAEASR